MNVSLCEVGKRVYAISEDKEYLGYIISMSDVVPLASGKSVVSLCMLLIKLNVWDPPRIHDEK